MASVNEKTVTIDGGVVHYYESGEGKDESMLLLHGGFGNAWLHWADIMPELATTHHVFAPDLPGYGQSDPMKRMSIARLVAWTAHFMDAVKITHTVLVGSSFGGLFLRLLAAEQPERAKALILVNGGVIPTIPAPAKFLASLPGIGGIMFNQVAKSTVKMGGLSLAIKTDDVITQQLKDTINTNRKPLGALMRTLSRSAIPEKRTPQCPTLLLWGEEDAITPRVSGEYIEEQIPSAKLTLIADVGHMPHLEAPDVFVGQIQNYLQQLDRPTTRHGGRTMLNAD